MGKNNMIKAFAWDIYAMVNACKRRGLSVEDYALYHVNQFVDWGRNWGGDNVRKSKSYKLGRLFLHPIDTIKNR